MHIKSDIYGEEKDSKGPKEPYFPRRDLSWRR
jgi:hypothetical protein